MKKILLVILVLLIPLTANAEISRVELSTGSINIKSQLEKDSFSHAQIIKDIINPVESETFAVFDRIKVCNQKALLRGTFPDVNDGYSCVIRVKPW